MTFVVDIFPHLTLSSEGVSDNSLFHYQPLSEVQNQISKYVVLLNLQTIKGKSTLRMCVRGMFEEFLWNKHNYIRTKKLSSFTLSNHKSHEC